MELTHFDPGGNAIMVDVSHKAPTHRVAVAKGDIHVSPAVLAAVQAGTAQKGDVLGVAQIAGIMGAKRTWEIIPLCHPLALTKCAIDWVVSPAEHCISCTCTVQVDGKTGVEMEALTGVSTALLTVYDMCKALDKTMVLSHIRLVHKEGGKSGSFTHD